MHIVLEALGMSGPGVVCSNDIQDIFAANRLPILLYPLIIQALLSAVKATSLAFMGDPMLQMLLGYNY